MSLIFFTKLFKLPSLLQSIAAISVYCYTCSSPKERNEASYEHWRTYTFTVKKKKIHNNIIVVVVIILWNNRSIITQETQTFSGREQIRTIRS